MEKEHRVNVYENEGLYEVIARVRYNSILDYWDGNNWTNGGTGLHKGLTKLRDGRYVLIHGTQWQGKKDYGIIISPHRALQEILKSNNEELLETKKFRELKKIYEEKINEEDDEDYETRKPVAILSTTVLPLDGEYDIKTLKEIPDISGVSHFIGHPATREIVEKLGAVKAESNLFTGLKVGETALAFSIAQGKSSRSQNGFTSPHQDVKIEDLSVRLIIRLA